MNEIIRRLIRTDGTTLDLPGRVTMTEIRELIGAETLNTVSLRHMSGPLHVMCVDDNGYETETVERAPGHFEIVCTKALKPVNELATKLYHLNCLPGTTHQIVGDVVIVPDNDFA